MCLYNFHQVEDIFKHYFFKYCLLSPSFFLGLFTHLLNLLDCPKDKWESAFYVAHTLIRFWVVWMMCWFSPFCCLPLKSVELLSQKQLNSLWISFFFWVLLVSFIRSNLAWLVGTDFSGVPMECYRMFSEVCPPDKTKSNPYSGPCRFQSLLTL